jgi:hypothetical protein
LLTRTLRFNVAALKQEDVINKIIEKSESVTYFVFGEQYVGPVTRDEIFDNHWMDVEALYRENGWGVKYDRPAYNEDYEPMFIFTATKKD